MGAIYPSDTSMFKLEKGRGKGHRWWSAKVIITTTGDTVDTGLDTLDAVQMTVVDAAVAANSWEVANVNSVTKGVIAMNSLILKDASTAFSAGGTIAYIDAIGYVKGYAES